MPNQHTNRPVVVITGSSGLIGQALSRRLAPSCTVVGCDITEPDRSSPGAFVYLDVTSDASVRQALDRIRRDHGGRLASVVHLAAYYDFSGEPSPRYDEITVQGTGRLLEALAGFEVEQFVFTSTMLVHAPVRPGEHLDETSPIEAKWPYPQSKLTTERLIRARPGGTPKLILRIAGIYTDLGQQPTLVQQIRRIYEQDLTSFLFPGNRETGQSLVHLDDVVDAIARGIERRTSLPAELTLLIGEADPPSYATLQDRIGELIWQREWPTLRVPETLAKVGAWVQDHAPGIDPFIKPFMIELADDHYALNIERARRFLGWAPSHHLLETLPTIIAALRRDPAAWYRSQGLEVPDARAEPSDR